MAMLNLKSGKPFAEPSARSVLPLLTRRKTLSGIAGILATSCAPSVLSASTGRGMMRGLGMRMAAMGGDKNPYDSKVEYIRFTGTQWFRIGKIFTGKNNLTFSMKLSVSNSMTDKCICGYRAANGETVKGPNFYKNNIDAQFPGVNNNSVASIDYGVIYEINFQYKSKESYIYIGNVKYTVSTNETSNCTSYIDVFFGAMNINGSANWFYIGDCYRYSASSNNVVLFDFIPVRVGSVGYMYDRVSKRLFGNEGTGAFILGPDKV